MAKFSELLKQILVLSNLPFIVRQGTILSVNVYLQNSTHSSKTTHLSGGLKGQLAESGNGK